MDASAEWSDVLDDTPEQLDEHEVDRLGRYVLCRRLADGGMGTVYLAKAEGPGGFERAFAIKRIHPHLARRKDLVEMFLDEARLSARIHHPNVCATVDFGEADGTWYLAMEYLLGESLASLVREVTQRPDLLATERWRGLVARVVADAAEGLHAAHELTDEQGSPLGVVHRDVSPQNLFVTYDGAVKVLDFGVARAEGRIHQTRAGALKGKVAYMAPEQVTAGASVDRRVDVFALGVCLWEALTGRRLFKRDTDVETLSCLSTLTIAPPSSVVPSIEPALDACVMGALERDPEARTATARDLAQALEAYLHARARPVTRADVAALMTERFSGRKAHKHEIVRTELAAVREERSGVVPVTPPPVAGGTASLVGPPRVGEATPSFVPMASAPASAPAPAPAPASASASARWGIAAALGVVAVLGIGLLAWSLRSPGPTAVVPEVAPPAELPRPAEAPPTEPRVEEGAVDMDLSDLPMDEPASPREQAPRRRRATTRTTPPTPPATEDARPGRVNVVTRGGWADVYLHGRLLGRTPRSVELPPGDHVLELRPFGETPGRQVRVHVEPGGVERVVEPVSH
ncbi:MAG: serine/threonine protein kinase [Myxococcales bacterium]|nr:serine/threonine protein kinase [Myxococcales bacterium]